MNESALDDAYASLLSARNIIVELWKEADEDSDLEASLEFAHMELVNILDGLHGFVSADHDWSPL